MYNLENEVKEPDPKCNYVSASARLLKTRMHGHRSRYDGKLSCGGINPKQVWLFYITEHYDLTIQTIGFTLNLQEIYDDTEIWFTTTSFHGLCLCYYDWR